MNTRSVIISAVAAPVLVLGGFAMVAIVPVAVVLLGTLRNARLRPLRWWSAALTAAYATPLAMWAIGPDRAPSLTKDMDPIFVPIIVAAALAVIAAYVVNVRATPASAGS